MKLTTIILRHSTLSSQSTQPSRVQLKTQNQQELLGNLCDTTEVTSLVSSETFYKILNKFKSFNDKDNVFITASGRPVPPLSL